ncbi:MAG: hypothetical protein LQ349_007886 [Xanthoria aureola]|nr:MAG: hypothetical protein LQ349_007886 [Xanthoria aureola]
MADPSKSTFNFGNPASSTSSGGLFGQQSTASSQPQSSLFGSSNKPATTSASGLFGAATTTSSGPSSFAAPGQSPGLFGGGGGAGGGSTLFGGANTKPTPNFSFGQNSAQQPSGDKPSLFQPTTNQQSGTSAPFSGFATPSKPTDSANAGSGQSSNLFGGGSSSLFQNPTSSTAGTAATPTSKPAWSFGPLGSTTPAGPPPSSQPSASNPFGQNPNNQQQEKKSLFPALGGGTSTNQSGTSTGTAPPSQNATASGSGLFGNPQASSSTQPLGSTGSGGMFGNTGGQSAAGSSTAQTSLFGNQVQPSAPGAQKPSLNFNTASSSQTSAQNPQKTQEPSRGPFSLGGQLKPPGSSATTSSTPVTNMFAPMGKPGEASTSAAPSTSLFSNLGTQSSSTPTAPSSAAASSDLFSNLGRPQNTPSTTAGVAVPSSEPQNQTPSLTSNLFNIGKPSASAAPSQPAPATKANTSGPPSGANATANSTLGASTNGPAPSAQSRLKNKSMDEIITRWASDLAKYQKEFQKQAEKVASWDRMLVDNSEKIQKLYGSTLEAERATVEVERQITAVENDQNELESWLDRYEKEVDQMISNQSDSFHGPDLERERTYLLAEKLSSRLDEMSKDLGSMVEEINDASSSLNKNSKPDDPLSQVVRVLNSHLTQLQQIDQGANALKLKVAAAEKAGRSLGPANGFNGPSSDAADSFYRSFMGKR